MPLDMRLLYIIFILFCASYARPQGTILGKASPPKPPVMFVENGGQIHDQNHKPRKDIVYAGQTGNVSYYIRKNGISYQFSKVQSWREIDGLFSKQKHKIPDTTVIYRLDATWIGSNSEISWAGEETIPGCENFYNSVSPEGLLNVKSYNAVSLQSIYDGIDIRYYSMGGSLKYD